MLNIVETGPVPNSLATELTIIDDRERSRREKEMAAARTWLDGCLKRAHREVFTEIVLITPSMATLLLHRNPDNRAVRKRLVADIRADIENGRWVFNGETIIVSKDGLLNDGQNRLTACRESNIPIKAAVVFGVLRSARFTTDQGAARRVGDYLVMKGSAEDAIVIAAVARMICRYEAYGDLSKPSGRLDAKKRDATKSEVLEVATARREAIVVALERIPPKTSKVFGLRSLLGFCVYLFSKSNDAAACRFIDFLIGGENIKSGDPIHTLRQRFIADPNMPSSQRFEAIVRAWNAFRSGSDLTKIQIMGRVPKVSK